MKQPDNLRKLPSAEKRRRPVRPQMPRVPASLSPEAGKWWKALHREFDLEDDYAKLLLQQALESFDLMRVAEAALRRDGVTLRKEDGTQQTHPASSVVRDQRALLLRFLKELHLDIEPLSKPGRPATR